MFSKQKLEDGVSPVVGVILMVAVTVILAAVIGAFVLDLGNNVQANPQAGVTFDQTSPSDATQGDADVTIQVISMENADSLSVQYDETDNTGTIEAFTDSSVGDTATVTNASAGEEITVIGTLDGKDAVLQTYTVDA